MNWLSKSVCIIALLHLNIVVWAQEERVTPFTDPKSKPMGVHLFHAQEIKKKTLNILIFIHPDCGLVNRYVETIRRLQVEFGSKTFAWFLVIPGKAHKRQEIVRYLNKHRLERYAIMLDPDYLLTSQLGVGHYPESVMLNNKGDLLFQGPLDDRLKANGTWSRTTDREYLKEAILAVLFQKKEYDRAVPLVGCELAK